MPPNQQQQYYSQLFRELMDDCQKDLNHRLQKLRQTYAERERHHQSPVTGSRMQCGFESTPKQHDSRFLFGLLPSAVQTRAPQGLTAGGAVGSKTSEPFIFPACQATKSVDITKKAQSDAVGGPKAAADSLAVFLFEAVMLEVLDLLTAHAEEVAQLIIDTSLQHTSAALSVTDSDVARASESLLLVVAEGQRSAPLLELALAIVRLVAGSNYKKALVETFVRVVIGSSI